MTHARQAGSYRYAFAFGLRSPEEYPDDFHVPEARDEFRAGLFLPREEPDWFGGSAWPPCILTLTRGALLIHAHPAENRDGLRIPLHELLSVESGHILLLGWLRFVARNAERTLRYNTAYSPPVREFLRELRDLFAGGEQAAEHDGANLRLRREIHLKLKYALDSELAPGERVLAWLHEPASVGTRRFWLFQRRTRSPADLLVSTSRRLIWITDRYQGSYERYAVIIRYAPAQNIQHTLCRVGGPSCELEIGFGAGEPWRISWPLEYQNGVEAFRARQKVA